MFFFCCSIYHLRSTNLMVRTVKSRAIVNVPVICSVRMTRFLGFSFFLPLSKTALSFVPPLYQVATKQPSILRRMSEHSRRSVSPSPSFVEWQNKKEAEQFKDEPVDTKCKKCKKDITTKIEHSISSVTCKFPLSILA